MPASSAMPARGEPLGDAAVERHERPPTSRPWLSASAAGSPASDVGEPTGLREWRDLARDVEDAHHVGSTQSPANFLKRGPADS